MTNQGDPLARRRNKLAPDPDVRRAIVAAASKTIREHGVRGLSVAAVLDRAHLSTRAFYRNFESKDQLVAAVFLEVTRTEVLRLRTKMAASFSPVEAVAAWIEGRLDLAFDEHIKSELRQVSQEANAAVFSSPELVSPAYDAILEPLIEQLQRGLELGIFQDIFPVTAAKSIHGVIWGHTQQQWATGHWEHARVRNRALRSACADWAWRQKQSHKSLPAPHPRTRTCLRAEPNGCCRMRVAAQSGRWLP